MHFHRSIFQMCCNRGTIIFHSANDSLPILELTTFNAQALYHKIKDVSPQACYLCCLCMTLPCVHHEAPNQRQSKINGHLT